MKKNHGKDGSEIYAKAPLLGQIGGEGSFAAQGEEAGGEEEGKWRLHKMGLK